MIFMAPERPTKDYKDTKNQLAQLKKDLQNMSFLDGDCFTLLRCWFFFSYPKNHENDYKYIICVKN